MTPVLAVCLLAAAPQMTASATEDLVVRFQGVEVQLLGAAQKKDVATVDPMLAKDFGYVLAVSDQKSMVMNRAEFLKSLQSFISLESFEVRNLSARAFGSVVVVNFGLLRKLTVGTRDRSGEFAITDVWLKDGKDYKLAARYASRPDVPAQ
jgi:hypothetical protein